MKKATSLQSSFSCENESNRITKLDHINALPLMYGQGSQSLYSVITRPSCVFFCALNMIYIRVLAEIQKPFEGNTASRSIAVETTRCLHGITLKTIGGHNHA